MLLAVLARSAALILTLAYTLSPERRLHTVLTHSGPYWRDSLCSFRFPNLHISPFLTTAPTNGSLDLSVVIPIWTADILLPTLPNLRSRRSRGVNPFYRQRLSPPPLPLPPPLPPRESARMKGRKREWKKTQWTPARGTKRGRKWCWKRRRKRR